MDVYALARCPVYQVKGSIRCYKVGLEVLVVVTEASSDNLFHLSIVKVDARSEHQDADVRMTR